MAGWNHDEGVEPGGGRQGGTLWGVPFPRDGLSAAEQIAAAPSRLDIATKLAGGRAARGRMAARVAEAERPTWRMLLYRDALEASASLSGGVVSGGGRGGPLGSDRHQGGAGRSMEEAGRRARGRLRRYCVANRLDRLVTLTYRGEGCHDPGALRADVAAFVKRLRRVRNLQSFPYAWVPELHESGHGFHVHLAVSQYLPKDEVEAAWGHGWVDLRRLASGMEYASEASRAKLAASYLAKYASKQWATKLAGLHRYEVGEGHQPKWMRLTSDTFEAVLTAAVWVMGGHQPVEVRSSSDWAGWMGPVTRWVRWDG